MPKSAGSGDQRPSGSRAVGLGVLRQMCSSVTPHGMRRLPMPSSHVLRELERTASKRHPVVSLSNLPELISCHQLHSISHEYT
jgi:hypothetical protein